ncbi:MAG: hypothetical protein ACOCT0_00485 [Halobacteriota archaeon]
MTELDQEELELLKKKTTKDDRLAEETSEDEDEDDVDYTPIDEVVLRKNADKDIDALKRETSRGERVEEDDEEQAVELRPHEEFEFDFGDEAVDDPYCGNCAAIEFEKHRGQPRPRCAENDCPTSLKPGHVCGDYVPQGLD